MPKHSANGKQKTGDVVSPPPVSNQKAGVVKPGAGANQGNTINIAPDSVPKPAETRKGSKNARPIVGGTAVAGAKSTQPRQVDENASQQQQQMESYNRDMRRRMERMGYNDAPQRTRTIQDQRKRRAERLKQRRQEQISHVKRSLPGGKVDTSTTRVYIMIAVVAVAIIALILIFAFIRHLI